MKTVGSYNFVDRIGYAVVKMCEIEKSRLFKAERFPSFNPEPILVWGGGILCQGWKRVRQPVIVCNSSQRFISILLMHFYINLESYPEHGLIDFDCNPGNSVLQMVTDLPLSNLDHSNLQVNGPSGQCSYHDFHPPFRMRLWLSSYELVYYFSEISEIIGSMPWLLLRWPPPVLLVELLISTWLHTYPADPGACVRVYWGCHSFTIIRIIFSPLSQVNCTNWLYEACINKIPKSNKYASILRALKKYQHVL